LKKGTTQLTKSEQYVVQKQPIPLDSCVFCDADSNDSSTSMSLKFAFVIIHLTRYYQVVSIFTLQAANKHDKELWIGKFQESIENYESIQLKDMLKCTPLYSSLSLRRCSSSRLMQPNTCINQNVSDVKPSHSGMQLEKPVENQGVNTEEKHCESVESAMNATTEINNSVLSDVQTRCLDIETI
uniref:PH domain-containing protein n=1 Tax=Brugia timori TaxID=42155 RepID=A0A0R3QSD0_9BILA